MVDKIDIQKLSTSELRKLISDANDEWKRRCEQTNKEFATMMLKREKKRGKSRDKLNI